ncbi:hypothetical protein JCM6882_006650 [Rhodosporidiobolus microsporus]
MNGHLVSPVPSTSAASSATLPPQPAGEYTPYMEELSNHLLAGWSSTEFADTQLRVQYADGSQGMYHIHALVVSQSPLLKKLLSAAFAHHVPVPASPRPVLLLPLQDPSITASSLSLSLASLYSPSVLTHLDRSTAPSVLATASFLGLDRLAALAFDLCEQSCREAKTAEEVSAWISYVEREKGPSSGFAGSSSASSTTNGSPALGPTPPGSVVNGKAPASSASSSSSGSFESRLRAVLLSRLISLPTELGAFDPARAAQTQPQLIDVLKRLPFEVFKAVIESTEFKAPSDMDRFNFAKKCIAARKQLFLSSSASSSPSSPSSTPALPPPEFEETVVLQFGQAGPGASAVNVLRKQRRPALWKIGGSVA